MLTVIETPMFLRYAQRIWSDAEREEFVSWIAENSEAGDVISGTHGLRKVRWSRAGMGKRGGARVIYWTRLASGEVVLLTVYDKSTQDNLSAAFLRELIKLHER